MSGSMFSRELSQKLGMSKDYLCVYRTFNRHLNSYNEAYDEVLQRRKEEEKILQRVQQIYYELKQKRSLINDFGKHLVDIGFYTKSQSVYRILNQAFFIRENFVPRDNIKRYMFIIREYEEWKKWKQ